MACQGACRAWQKSQVPSTGPELCGLCPSEGLQRPGNPPVVCKMCCLWGTEATAFLRFSNRATTGRIKTFLFWMSANPATRLHHKRAWRVISAWTPCLRWEVQASQRHQRSSALCELKVQLYHQIWDVERDQSSRSWYEGQRGQASVPGDLRWQGYWGRQRQGPLELFPPTGKCCLPGKCEQWALGSVPAWVGFIRKKPLGLEFWVEGHRCRILHRSLALAPQAGSRGVVAALYHFFSCSTSFFGPCSICPTLCFS